MTDCRLVSVRLAGDRILSGFVNDRYDMDGLPNDRNCAVVNVHKTTSRLLAAVAKWS